MIVFCFAEVADGGWDGEERRVGGDAGGEFFEDFDGGEDGGFDGGVDVVVVGGGQAEAQGGDGLLHGFDVVFGGVLDAVDVGGIVAGHLVEHEGGVFDGAGDGAAVIERGAAGDDAADGDEADGGFEADDSAPGGWDADAAAGVGAECAEGEVGRDGCAGAGGGAAADAVERPGIAGGAEVGDVAGAADGELVEVELADDDGSGEFEAADDVGVFGGDAVAEHGAGSGGAGAGGVDVVFERDGNAVEWAAEFAGFLFGVEFRGLRSASSDMTVT